MSVAKCTCANFQPDRFNKDKCQNCNFPESAHNYVVVQHARNSVTEYRHMDRFNFVSLVLTTVIMTILFIAILALYWASASAGGRTLEVGIWKACSCIDVNSLKCTDQKDRFNTVKAFSLMSLIFEALILIGLFYESTHRGKFQWMFHVLLGFGVALFLSLMISWAVFAGLFEGLFCDINLKKISDLNFCFFMRIAEWIIIFFLCIMWLLQVLGKVLKSSNNVSAQNIIMIVVTGLTLISTVTRGWATQAKTEIGVWAWCTCLEVKDYKCSNQKEMMTAVEAFAILSIGAMSAIMLILLKPCARLHHLVLPILAWSDVLFTILSWAIFAGWYDNKYCDDKVAFKDVGKLDWCFWFFVIASGLGIFLGVIVTMNARGSHIPYIHGPRAAVSVQYTVTTTTTTVQKY